MEALGQLQLGKLGIGDFGFFLFIIVARTGKQ
jgi:hypothetical protein